MRIRSTGEIYITNENAKNMITVHASNSTMELAEVIFNRYMLIDYNGNEYMVLEYFGEKSLYKLHHDERGRMEITYIDTIDKIDSDESI
jgi:hypothetical protein